MTTDSSTGDWTPKREREARERCAAATPGPWGVFEQDCLCWITGPTRLIGDEGEMSRSVAAFIAHARADLPAALAEIERLRDLLREADKAPAEKCARCDKPAGETAVRDGVDTLCMACSIDDLDGRYIDGESGSR